MNEIPVLAFDSFVIIRNTSQVHDDFIMHRLSLVPVKCSDVVDGFRMPPCKNSCPKCSITFYLNITNNDQQILNVRTSHFENSNNRLFEDIIIVKLNKNDTITLEASTVKGIGKMHAKFYACNVYMNYDVRTMNPSEFNFEIETLGSLTPEKILKSGLKIYSEKYKLPLF